jgi:hypothetical protein
MNKKRGQITGTGFVYLLSAIVIAFILIFGYRSITGAKETFDETELALFKNKLASDIRSMSTDFGSSKKVTYSHPVKELCLLDLNKKADILDNEKIGSYPLIKSSMEGNIEKNVFILNNEVFDSLYLEEIEISDPFFHCFRPIAGKISFVIEGLGNRTLILDST